MGEVKSLGCGVTESSGLQVVGTLLTFAVEVENRRPVAPPSMAVFPTVLVL